MKEEYIGKELENFSVAKFWRNYVIFNFSKYFKNKNKDVLEVGSGIGSFSEIIIKNCNKVTLLEPDKNFYFYLSKKFKDEKKIKEIINGSSQDLIGKKYDIIFHLQVLEHLEDDQLEITRNLELLNNNGYLLICIPSFMELYSNFDKAIGHYRRYVKKDFKKFDLHGSKIVKSYYIDSSGYLIYKIFKMLLNSPNPKKIMIYLWDRILIPISIFLDKIFCHKIGKNLIVIIKKS